jgi:hypothetical protein
MATLLPDRFYGLIIFAALGPFNEFISLEKGKPANFMILGFFRAINRLMACRLSLRSSIVSAKVINWQRIYASLQSFIGHRGKSVKGKIGLDSFVLAGPCEIPSPGGSLFPSAGRNMVPEKSVKSDTLQ